MDAPCGPTEWEYLNHYFSTIGSLILNFLLFIVINLRQRVDLSSYTILLKINCIVDFINSLFNCLLFIHEDASSGLPVYVINGVLKYLTVYIPSNFKHYLFTICAGFLLSTATFSVIPFIYRYLILCRQYHVSMPLLASFYSIIITPNIIACILYAYLIDKYSPILVDLVHNGSSRCLDNLEWTTSYSGFSIKDEWDIRYNNFTTLNFILVLVSYIPILFCGFAIVRYLRKNRDKITDPKIQNGINWTLAIQSLIPIIMCGTPIFMGIYWKGPGFKIISFRFIFRFIVWVPFFNPCAAFFFIRPYREFILDLMRSIVRPGGYSNSSIQFLTQNNPGPATITS